MRSNGAHKCKIVCLCQDDFFLVCHNHTGAVVVLEKDQVVHNV